MRCAGHLALDTPAESSDDLPISNRIFFLTDEPQAPRAEFQAVLAGLKVVAIFDNDEWKRRLDS
jgi:hypothetical protein